MDDGPDEDALQSNLAKLYECHDDQNSNDTSPLPKAFDWRTKNVANSSVKNQHRCLSCYAFATVAVLKSVYAIKTNSKNVIEFRPQQIVDCARDENEDCTGGDLFQSSMKYLIEKGGKIATDASYYYVGKDQSCRTEGINEIDLGTVEYVDIPVGDEKQMAEVLINNGSIFIGLDADSELFTFYESSVLTIDDCSNHRYDMEHAMVVVGYGYDEGLKPPYWIIKNLYEPSWGGNGYLRLIKDDNNICSIATIESYAKLT
ncbi:unnamed protein product [Rotaria sp. Silwood1]|nr:unnamed protein product [Rotaria sp. Silwood1]